MHDHTAMMIPPEPSPYPRTARPGTLRREDHAELNWLLSRATRCLEDMDLSGANEALKRANEAASGLSSSKTAEVKM